MAPRNNSGAPSGMLNLRGKPLDYPRHEGPMRPDRWPSPRWPRAVRPAPARIPQRYRAGAAGGRHPGAAGCPRPRGRQRRGRGTALPGRPRARRSGARDRTGSGAGGARPAKCRRQWLARSPLHGSRHRVAAGARRIRPRLRQSALSRRRRHAIAGCFPPRRQARSRRAAGGLGNRAGTPVAAARYAQLHPVGRVAGRRR